MLKYLLIYITFILNYKCSSTPPPPPPSLSPYEKAIQTKDISMLRNIVYSGYKQKTEEEMLQVKGLFLCHLFMKKWSEAPPIGILNEEREENILLHDVISSYTPNTPLPSIIYYILAVEEERSSEMALSNTAMVKAIALYKKAIFHSPREDRQPHQGALYRLANLALKGHHTFPKHLAKLLSRSIVIDTRSPNSVAKYYLSLNTDLQAKYFPSAVPLSTLEIMYLDENPSVKITYPLRLLEDKIDDDHDHDAIDTKSHKIQHLLEELSRRKDRTSKKIYSLIRKFIEESVYLLLWKIKQQNYSPPISISPSEMRGKCSEFLQELNNVIHPLDQLRSTTNNKYSHVKKTDQGKPIIDAQDDDLLFMNIIKKIFSYMNENITENFYYQIGILIFVVIFSLYFISIIFRLLFTTRGSRRGRGRMNKQRRRNNIREQEEIFDSDNDFLDNNVGTTTNTTSATTTNSVTTKIANETHSPRRNQIK